MNNKIRVGIVGTSGFAVEKHYGPLASHPAVELTALCGRNRERAEERAAQFNIPQVYTDWREMIEQSGVDAVVVVTPDDLHYPVTMTALNAGKHVFCEKTLAMNAQQAREMYETAEQKGLVHMTLFTWRWEPGVLYMKDLIAQNYLGELYHGQFHYITGFSRTSDYHWRVDARHSHGMLADLGSHMIDLARNLCGDIARTACRTQMFVDHVSPDGSPLEQNNDSTVCLLEFTSGAHATLQVSSVAYLGTNMQHATVQLYGANGTLFLEKTDNGVTLSGVTGQGQPLQPLKIPEQYQNSYMESSIGERLFIDSILSGGKPVPSFYEGWKAQQVIDAALESDRSGRWVEIHD
jgi:predicted dehydrogenase